MGGDINGINLKWSFSNVNNGRHLFRAILLNCHGQDDEDNQAMKLHVSDYEISELATVYIILRLQRRVIYKPQ